MFICKKCVDKHEPLTWPFFLHHQSYGPCELCGDVDVCIDHHGFLPPLKKEFQNKEGDGEIKT